MSTSSTTTSTLPPPTPGAKMSHSDAEVRVLEATRQIIMNPSPQYQPTPKEKEWLRGSAEMMGKRASLTFFGSGIGIFGALTLLSKRTNALSAFQKLPLRVFFSGILASMASQSVIVATQTTVMDNLLTMRDSKVSDFAYTNLQKLDPQHPLLKKHPRLTHTFGSPSDFGSIQVQTPIPQNPPSRPVRQPVPIPTSTSAPTPTRDIHSMTSSNDMNDSRDDQIREEIMRAAEDIKLRGDDSSLGYSGYEGDEHVEDPFHEAGYDYYDDLKDEENKKPNSGSELKLYPEHIYQADELSNRDSFQERARRIAERKARGN